MDKRTLEKFEREARAKNRETWYLSWALDLNPEEREKVGARHHMVGLMFAAIVARGGYETDIGLSPLRAALIKLPIHTMHAVKPV